MTPSKKRLTLAALALIAPAAAAVAQPTMTPARPVPEERKNQQPKQESLSRVADLPTHVPYPKLAQKGEDGKIVRLVELPDILALRSNPTVGPRSVELIMPVLYARRARFEQILIQNLDLYWMVTDGRLDEISMNNISEMSQIAEMLKPLVGRTTLSQELLNRGLLTRTQGGMNQYIVNEYKQAINNEIQFESEDPLSDVMRFVMKDSIHETIQAYNAMMAELSIKADELVEELGLESDAAKKLASMAKPLNEDRQEQIAELDAFDQAFRALDLDDAIALLTAMRKSRANENVSPAIQEITVMHPGKIDATGSKAMQGQIRYQDGRVLDTRDSEERFERLRKKALGITEETGEESEEEKEAAGSDD